MEKPSNNRPPFDPVAEEQRVLRIQSEMLRELYLAGIPITDPGGSPTEEQWSRWFGAMHDAHEWTRLEDEPLWPAWAAVEEA